MALDPFSNQPALPESSLSETDWLSKYPSLRRVAIGLGMIYASIVITLLLVIGGFFSMLFFHKQPFTLASPYMVISILYALEFLTTVGTLLCLSTPSDSGANNYIVSSVMFMLISISITLAASFFQSLPEMIKNINPPAWVVSEILFVLYLRKLALFLNAPKLVIAARKVLIAVIISGGLFLAFFHFISEIYNPTRMRLPQANTPAPGFALAFGLTTLAWCIVSLYVLVKYGNLLSNLRKTIRSGQSHP
jgi:hypothetical protein